jgi:hypothetical protein
LHLHELVQGLGFDDGYRLQRDVTCAGGALGSWMHLQVGQEGDESRDTCRALLVGRRAEEVRGYLERRRRRRKRKRRKR